MMPLCTSAILAGASAAAFGPGEKCGCALCTAGAPCVAQRVWAMPVPASMCSLSTCASQLGHARGAARAPQAAALVHRDAAGVVAAVFEPLQALDQDRNDVARADRADDAAHGMVS